MYKQARPIGVFFPGEADSAADKSDPQGLLRAHMGSKELERHHYGSEARELERQMGESYEQGPRKPSPPKLPKINIKDTPSKLPKINIPTKATTPKLPKINIPKDKYPPKTKTPPILVPGAPHGPGMPHTPSLEEIPGRAMLAKKARCLMVKRSILSDLKEKQASPPPHYSSRSRWGMAPTLISAPSMSLPAWILQRLGLSGGSSGGSGGSQTRQQPYYPTKLTGEPPMGAYTSPVKQYGPGRYTGPNYRPYPAHPDEPPR